MKRIDVRVFTFATVLATALACPLSAHAQDAADLFKSKCAMCHGVDGKKVEGHDLTSADVQKQSDAELTDTITKGKDKMPPFGEKLKPEEIRGLVAYIRTLKQ
jgi:mono/diheme cytochrome c family protein